MPGLLLIGLGLGAMLTPSVNVVQSSFPEAHQGEISGLSRSISNLGSSFGTAIAGTILVSVVALGTQSYAVAMIVLAGFGLIGLVAALRLPQEDREGVAPARGLRADGHRPWAEKESGFHQLWSARPGVEAAAGSPTPSPRT